MVSKMSEKVDFLSEEYKLRIENLKIEIKNIWDSVWNNEKIKNKQKEKEFKNRFYNEILPKFFENLPFNTKSKLLKVYELYEEDLRAFIKNNLTKNHNGKKYCPKIPSAKEIYKWLILNKSEEYTEELKESLALEKLIENDDHNKNLPKHAYLIEINFTLKKPYISRDDENFYIIDNPIVKDKVFKVPMIRASTWKGALRFAMIKVFEEKLDNKEINEQNWKKEKYKIYRLLGNEKKIEDKDENYLDEIIAEALNKEPLEIKKEFQTFVKSILDDGESLSKRGRLTFYPTFFDRISLEVITPLSRETKTPSLGPIYFEIVPENTTGKLRILYYPYDLIAVGEFDKIENEVKEDFRLLGEALKKLFYEIGFSAKKTSGFGTAKIEDIKIYPENDRLSEQLKNILIEN